LSKRWGYQVDKGIKLENKVSKRNEGFKQNSSKKPWDRAKNAVILQGRGKMNEKNR